MKAFVIDDNGVQEISLDALLGRKRMDGATLAAGSFLIRHIMTKLIHQDQEDDLGEIPLRDRVGAMILLAIVMRWIVKAQEPGLVPPARDQFAFDIALNLYARIGASTGLTPVGGAEGLLQQLN